LVSFGFEFVSDFDIRISDLFRRGIGTVKLLKSFCLTFRPLEFMQRLAALVPRPRLHLIRFHGVLAPNAKLRGKIIPSPVEQATEPACDDAQAQGAPARMSWARLLKRVFDIDIEHCPNCGGRLKIIAAIEDPPVIVKILSHRGLPTRAPPHAPVRRFDLFQTI
jgi:Putative transposase